MFISKNIPLINEGADEKDFHAMYFDGTSLNAIDCGSDSSLDVGTGSFSAFAWYKVIDSSVQYHPIVSKGNGLGNGVGWCITHRTLESDGTVHNRIYLDVVNTTGGEARTTDISGVNSVSTNEWIHVGGVFDNASDTLATYINGALASTPADASGTNDLSEGAFNFFIGREANVSRQLKGYIADVAYYNTVLDAADVATIFNNGNLYDNINGISNSNLKGWWRPGNGAPNMIGTGDIIPDLSGTGNDGTVQNSFVR
jgi:hypothetical protein